MSIRVARAGEQLGIWEVAELQLLVDRGEILRTDLVWAKGFLDWKPLGESWSELGIAPPVPGTVAPPIPSNAARSPHDKPAQVMPSSKADLSEVKFRTRPTRRYGFSPGTKVAFALALLVGGWAAYSHGLPWLSERWAANFEPDSPVAASTSASVTAGAPQSSGATAAAPPSQQGRVGMSQAQIIECEKHMAEFRVISNVAGNFAHITGPQTAAQQVIDRFNARGVSLDCQRYLASML